LNALKVRGYSEHTVKKSTGAHRLLYPVGL
jgi:hypothetical protein